MRENLLHFAQFLLIWMSNESLYIFLTLLYIDTIEYNKFSYIIKYIIKCNIRNITYIQEY
jgi:cellulose synthase/poly-beta-1,6-N-acetylglucosamine synthase-like glycosyltransferase